jgi:hypothetical protein
MSRRPLKVYVLDNCYDCPMSGYGMDREDRLCCITGSNVYKYDADFMKHPEFPPDCPLRDYKTESGVRGE